MAMARTVIVEKPKGVEQCIEDCLDCHSVCLETADSCRQMSGMHM